MSVNINYVLFIKYYKVKKNYILAFCWCIEESNRVHTLKSRSSGYVPEIELENMTTIMVTSNLYNYNYDYYCWYGNKYGNKLGN